MRIIVACKHCRRQYDASGLAPGERFSCHCGQKVTVTQPRGHDAAVVRCSSCGAARQGSASACGHCGGDFTIHEQDLHTVCPQCLARVSDRARYCHHCAALLVAEAIRGEECSSCCPVCGPESNLMSRQLRESQLHVMECQRCGGFWVGLETFERLMDHEARRPASASSRRTRLDAPGKTPYRPCAECGALMVRWNFGRSSGVLVDVCNKHGIWFDAQELAHVMRWIRSGNLQAAHGDLTRLRQASLAARSAELRPPRRADTGRIDAGGTSYNDFDLGADIAATIASVIGRFLQIR